MGKMNQNNFDDFQELAKNQSLEFSKSGCYQAFGGEFNEDVAAQMAEQQGLEFEAFEPINEAFEAELESNEKELEDEQRFVIQVYMYSYSIKYIAFASYVSKKIPLPIQNYNII